MNTTLYLIPNLISNSKISNAIPALNTEIINSIEVFIVENIRDARRFLKKINPAIDINSLIFIEINKNEKFEDILMELSKIEDGKKIGLLSDAGLPCVADPGNIVVMWAHRNKIKVIPLVGPSSIFLALMASGLNGQNFAFNGYIPIEKKDRINKIKQLENRSKCENQTQIFMDTPYRNNNLLSDLLQNLSADTKLCIAYNIMEEDEFIDTKSIIEWGKIKIDLNKKPCIFLI